MVSRKLLTTNGKITLTIEEVMEHIGRYDIEVLVRGIRGSYSSPDDTLILPFFIGKTQWVCLKNESDMKFKQVWLPPIVDWAVAGDKVAFVVHDKHKSIELMYINDRSELVLYNEVITPRPVHHHLSKKGVLVTTDALGATIVLLPKDIIRTNLRDLGQPKDVDVLDGRYAVAFENGVVENAFGSDTHTMVPGVSKVVLLDDALAVATASNLTIWYAKSEQNYRLPSHIAKGDFIRTPDNEVVLPLMRLVKDNQIEVGIINTDGQFRVVNRIPELNPHDRYPKLLDVQYTASGITFAVDCVTTVAIIDENGYRTMPLEGLIFDFKLTHDGIAAVGSSDFVHIAAYNSFVQNSN
jgi:hypothetical protein